MRKKIVGIFIMTLLITATALPVLGIMNEEPKRIIGNYFSKDSNEVTSTTITRGSSSGGVQQGVHIRQICQVHQNKYHPAATDLHFKIWQKEDNIDVNGWSVTISGFPNVNSQRGSQPPPHNNNLENHPDIRPKSNDADNGQHAVDVSADGASIPYCTFITIEWEWWLTHWNTKHIADLQWTKDAAGAQAAPNHGWNINPPKQNPNNPTKYFHNFTFSNDDDKKITVCNLSFLATMDWYDNLTDIIFPPPYDLFTLQPGENYIQDIVTTGPLYGGHIYFKYGIIESSGKLDDEPVLFDVVDHPITEGPGIVWGPDVPDPWSTWNITTDGLGCTVEYGEPGTTDPPIVITPSYVPLQEYIESDHLTWAETQDLPWIPLDTIIIIPGYTVNFTIPMNYGDTAALLRFKVAFNDDPEKIIEHFIAEAILDEPWPMVSSIKNELTNFLVCNFHDVKVDTLEFDFIGYILPDAIVGWYDPDPPGNPYLSGDIWYGGWGCPPEIKGYDTEYGIGITWIDIDTEIQPDQWVYFGLSIDPYASIHAIPDVKWGNYQENTIPNKPDKPSGSASGKPGTVYIYSTKTTDPDGDELFYRWNWGEGTTSGWTGPYSSGQQVSASHTWVEKGSYDVTVKSKDYFGYEGGWSDPLSVSMPRNRAITWNSLLMKVLEHYPLLERILNLQ
jgi:hypothetical protein